MFFVIIICIKEIKEQNIRVERDRSNKSFNHDNRSCHAVCESLRSFWQTARQALRYARDAIAG